MKNPYNAAEWIVIGLMASLTSFAYGVGAVIGSMGIFRPWAGLTAGLIVAGCIMVPVYRYLRRRNQRLVFTLTSANEDT